MAPRDRSMICDVLAYTLFAQLVCRCPPYTRMFAEPLLSSHGIPRFHGCDISRMRNTHGGGSNTSCRCQADKDIPPATRFGLRKGREADNFLTPDTCLQSTNHNTSRILRSYSHNHAYCISDCCSSFMHCNNETATCPGDKKSLFCFVTS